MIRLEPVSVHSGSIAAPLMSQASGQTRMMSYPVRTKVTPKQDEDSSARVARFLRRARPVKTAEMVAADTGMPVTTVKSWLRGAAKPSFDGMVAMVSAYGPSFLAAIMPRHLGWLDEAALRARTAELRAEQERIEREIAGLNA